MFVVSTMASTVLKSMCALHCGKRCQHICGSVTDSMCPAHSISQRRNETAGIIFKKIPIYLLFHMSNLNMFCYVTSLDDSGNEYTQLMLCLNVAGLRLCGEIQNLLAPCVAFWGIMCSLKPAVQYNDDSLWLPLTARIISYQFCRSAITW